MSLVTDDDWMGLAIALANEASSQGEVPVGCVLVAAGPVGDVGLGLDLSRGGGVEVARAHNLRERSQDPTAHAEVLALREAARRLGSWRLDGVTAYVTLEPCAMCAGALVLARVQRVVFGCDDPKAGAIRSLYAIGQDVRLNHRFEVTPGVRAEACAAPLQAFFAALRAKGKK